MSGPNLFAYAAVLSRNNSDEFNENRSPSKRQRHKRALWKRHRAREDRRKFQREKIDHA